MKKLFTFVFCLVLLISGQVFADLTVIGTATYEGVNYNLIYEDDSIDGGLVWLDYKNSGNWTAQNTWATNLGASLTINLTPGYTTSIVWTTGWRLPETQQKNSGYNIAGSEMGHLYYVSLKGIVTPFTNIPISMYWSATACDGAVGRYWVFSFDTGNQGGRDKSFNGMAIAVIEGTVTVP